MALLLLGCFILLSLPQTVNAAAQATILSHSSYLDSLGYYTVVGEVQNTGDMHLRFVKISATFYDSADHVVDTSLTYSGLEVLLVGRKSPFKVLLYDAQQSAKVDHYHLEVEYDISEFGKPEGLQIVSSSSYVDILDWMHVVGEIGNIGVYPTTWVKVYATFYDTAGKVIDYGFDYTNPHDLNVGEKASFEILLVSERASLVDSYELTAESDQYAIVPEFPSVIIALLSMITVMAMIVFKKKNK